MSLNGTVTADARKLYGSRLAELLVSLNGSTETDALSRPHYTLVA